MARLFSYHLGGVLFGSQDLNLNSMQNFPPGRFPCLRRPSFFPFPSLGAILSSVDN